ncbi:deoxyribonuclease-1 isoform X2 [Eurytemora carolleeae]|uniref:deoxyribonuclease-1 isoform X2 n=1 Tax=Eurytemora carolleeae TaxID=1294199 RepID=UPI000C782901|nr:deoxyribonuclease-1 isoform X2 [Eurytemora carolleeae]|eukprot:XP_023335778.1 deoxyribonuclease-1-like isoform X2 [Eurytemora affinis]
MGKCLSVCRHRDENENDSAEKSDQDQSFQEKQRRKTRDEHRRRISSGETDRKRVVGEGGDDERQVKHQGRRRKSSGLSRYSGDGRHVVENPFSIAAFNVKRFGVSKMSDPKIVDILVSLVTSFDVMLIQEVVDVSGKAVKALLQAVNDASKDQGEYDVLVSDRVGRTNQKEQYAVYFRKAKVQILDSSVYADPGDIFIREPLIVRMKCNTVIPGASELTMICIHTQPKSANKEIDQLYEVHKHVTGTLGAKNVILLGDFNAGGTYIRSQDWETNRLRGDEFNWLIPDHMDTTTTNTLAAYDRIVVWGEELLKAVVPNSAQVYRFDQALGIDQDTLNKVSDHYPVVFSLQTCVHPTLEKNIRKKISFMFTDKRFPEINPQTLLNDVKIHKFKTRSLYDETGALKIVELRSHKISKLSEVGSHLEKLRAENKNLLSYSVLAALQHELKLVESAKGKLSEEEKGKYLILLVLDLELKNLTCSVEIQTNLNQGVILAG